MKYLPTTDRSADHDPVILLLRSSRGNIVEEGDGLEEAIRGVHDFLDGETVWDEEKADEEFYEDTLTPALQALADEMAGDDLAAFLAGMRSGESRELHCENGAFEIVRDR